MMEILKNINWELLHDGGIGAIVGSRVFYKNPINVPSDSYVVFARETRQRDMVSDMNIFQIACFSKDMLVLENMTNAVIDCFEGKKSIGENNDFVYSLSLISQTDNTVMLENGFYYSIMTFEIKFTS